MKKYLLLLMVVPFWVLSATPRVITLGGDITEIAWALGVQAELVGRDTTSTWPEAANKLPDVGYVRQLNTEGILSLHPTLVLAGSQAQPSSVLNTVAENHVRVVTVPGDNTLSAIDQKIAVVAAALGKTAPGEKLRQHLAAEIAALPTTQLNKRVLFLLSHGGMGTQVAGQETAADSAIRAAGLQNSMQGFTHYRGLSQEGIIASKPDLIVISADGLKSLGGEAGLWKLPGLAETPAGRNKQVLFVDDMALLGFSLRTPQALLALRHKAEQLP